MNVLDIMERVRNQVATEIANSKDALPEFIPHEAEVDIAAGALLRSEDLRFANHNYRFGAEYNPQSITSHRSGFIGSLIVKIKRTLFRSLWNGLLRDYLGREAEFNASIVRFLNEVSKFVDARDASNFWALIRKIDVDVTRAVERAHLLSDEFHGSLQTHIQSVEQSLKSFTEYFNKTDIKTDTVSAAVKTLENVVGGLEGIISRGTKQQSQHFESSSLPDQSYVLFENRFRGSEAEIKERLSFYVPHLKSLPGEVLEIGCGRGELLSLLQEAHIKAFGVDLDSAMVDIAVSKGLNATHQDALKYLKTHSDSTLGGVIAIQVIEHLTLKQNETLLSEVLRVLKPGGKVIFETINPKSVVAFVSNYARDRSHIFPQHPDTVRYSLQQAGFKNIRVEYLSDIPQSEKLQKIESSPHYTQLTEVFTQTYNKNVERLNELLYGAQDYCVIGEK